MFEAPDSPYLVPFDGSFDVASASTSPQTDGHPHKGKHRAKRTEDLNKLQRVLAAGDRHAPYYWSSRQWTRPARTARSDPLCRASTRPAARYSVSRNHRVSSSITTSCGVRRVGCRSAVASEYFNRSQYEEVLVVRVHPEILGYQKLPGEVNLETIWEQRLTSIRHQEEHLARNGTVILKFWLNVSRDEQKRRFLARLDDPDKNWKFEPHDVEERRYWNDYMQAYQDALNATSRPWAPWYAIPADDKSYMRARVADIIIDTLQSIGLKYPEPSAKDRAEFADARAELDAGDTQEEVTRP